MVQRIQVLCLGVALLAATASLAQDRAANDAVEKAKQLTVMINVTTDGDTRPGAGIIFGVANEQIYIATANHLVRRGMSTASEIRVEFPWLRGQPVPAELLTYYDERALDLAVIVVDRAKARIGRTHLPWDRLVTAQTLAHDSGVFAIGYPNGSAFDVSAGQISQVEAVLLKYRVPGLLPGGYSGGPLVDKDGRIVGMIVRDQPPDGEATPIDLIVKQLRAWNYQVGSGAGDQPDGPTGNEFRETLLRYIAEAPSGFRALGAKQIGNWAPSVTLPEAISCRGGGGAREPFIECVLYRSASESEAASSLEDIIDMVQAALPEWQKSRANMYWVNFKDARSEAVVNVNAYLRGSNYDVTVTVLATKPSSKPE
jgi:hypothetical protein